VASLLILVPVVLVLSFGQTDTHIHTHIQKEREKERQNHTQTPLNVLLPPLLSALVNIKCWQKTQIPVQRVVKPCFVQLDGDAGHTFIMVIVVVDSITGRSLVVTGGTQAAVARFNVGARAHRMSRPDVGDVDERLVDEDDGDEDGEALLREASDVADECAEIEGDRQQKNERHPDADPQAKRQKVDIVFST